MNIPVMSRLGISYSGDIPFIFRPGSEFSLLGSVVLLSCLDFLCFWIGLPVTFIPGRDIPFQRYPGLGIFQLVLKEASRLYAASWVRDIGPDLRPNDYKKDDGTEGKSNRDKTIAARGGMETLGPALERLYMTRASAYRDALKSFIEGYEEGIQQVMEKKEDSSIAQQEGNNTDKNST
ncbi:hypothetical protein ES319_A09G000200v1 [Gossypium barbadense]|uniref:Uncharacterized protein n=1 Tax=Gossypium barbadense TaxID=3634 RepID=A0A5J5U9C4_GOSBA|nr:hypothetical protein ES319_A09G000200v1 [Gossypium barbadense]